MIDKLVKEGVGMGGWIETDGVGSVPISGTLAAGSYKPHSKPLPLILCFSLTTTVFRQTYRLFFLDV